MPDEHSNLNLPAASRRPAARPAGASGRRRGRRGGRGRARVPRPVTDKTKPSAEDLPPEPAAEETMVHEVHEVHDAIAEPEADTSGDFREPHPEDDSGDAAPPEDLTHAEPVSEAPEAPAEPVVEAPRAPEPEHRREREHDRPAERPHSHSEQRRPEPRPWVKPANFRPAETSAISQAVAHATEIAESLKHTIDQLDEILELVEVAERQKLADEREIDELRRALRRIQPPRHQQQDVRRGPRPDEPHRGHRDHAPRQDGGHGHGHPRHEAHESSPRHEEPRPPETGEPPARPD